MASNLLNNQLKQLQKLGKDVGDLEKKLNKIFGDVDEGKASPKCQDRNPSTVTKRIKPLSNEEIRSSRKRPIPKCERKNKCATLEVTVKTKRHGKSNKSNIDQERDPKNVSRRRDKAYVDDTPSEGMQGKHELPSGMQHCCCPANSENMVWSNILKHSKIPDSALRNTGDETSLTSHKGHLKGNPGNNCRNKHSQQLSNKSASKPSMRESGKEISESGKVCNDLLNSKKLNQEDAKARNMPQLSNVVELNTRTTANGEGGLHPNNGSSLQPIDSLCMLMEELRRATANQPSQALVQDMEVALKRLCKVAAASSEASSNSKLSSKKASNGDPVEESSLKVNNDRMGISSDKPRLVANAMVQVPSCSPSDGINLFTNGVRTKEDNISPSVPVQNSQRKFAIAEKFELLVKLNDDDGARRQYILGNDEKLKAEIEFLNKQLNLQLKSVEGLSTKEPEYHKLISSLIEKVDKLEVQVNEQTKVSQHFYGHCNSLLEQNSVIPKMQKKLDLLNKQLQDTVHSYDKLKIEYSMVKLENDKLHDLNCEKDKEIKRFKEEIVKIQNLVAQQIQNVKSYVGYSSAAEKVDTLLSVIDSQSNLIKSKINTAKEFDEASISAMESISSSSSSPQSRPISPFSFSVKLNSPEKICKSSNGDDAQKENFAKDNH